MKEHFEKFLIANTDTRKSEILEDLEYYVHKIDNALDFLHLSGMDQILLPSINSSTSSLRRMSCHLLGAAAQSNPKFQRAAHEAGLVGPLLRLVSLDPVIEVSSKALYALSAILRNFPEAQSTFLRQGGLGVFTNLFDREGREYNKLQVKMVTLLHDLLLERQSTNPVVRKSYEAVNLEAQIL